MATQQQEAQIEAVPNNVTRKKKASKGKQKIEIKKISNYKNRQVSFSKRRTSLFKKADALSIQCNVRVAVFALSEKGRPYECGTHNAETLINQFLTTSDNDKNTSHPNPIISTGTLEEFEKHKEFLLEMRANVETRNHEITGVKTEVVVDEDADLLGFDNHGLLGHGVEGTLGNNINTTVTTDYHSWDDHKGSFGIGQQWSYLPLVGDVMEGISSDLNDNHQWSYVPGLGDDNEVEGISGNLNDNHQWSYLPGLGDDNAVEGISGNLNDNHQWSYLPLPGLGDVNAVEGISGNLNDNHLRSYQPQFGDEFAVEGISGNNVRMPSVDKNQAALGDNYDYGNNNLGFGSDYGWVSNEDMEWLQSILDN